MNTFLIAEMGLCHDGTLWNAKETIRVAKECGADAVKGQAFMAKDVKGSMPSGFYEQRQMSIFQFTELIQYGKEIGIDVFFSIFSWEFKTLKTQQKWHKFAASQSKNKPREVEAADNENVIVSVNPMTRLPNLSFAQVLYACPYLPPNPQLECIIFLNEFYNRQVGYSDHTIGVDWCLEAHREFGARVIEKHFTLTRDIYFEGKQFRDAIHGALPNELERLAKGLK